MYLFGFQFRYLLRTSPVLTSLPLSVKGASSGSSIMTDASKFFCATTISTKSNSEELRYSLGVGIAAPSPATLPPLFLLPVALPPPPIASAPPDASPEPRWRSEAAPGPVQIPEPLSRPPSLNQRPSECCQQWE